MTGKEWVGAINAIGWAVAWLLRLYWLLFK
jgi:hypothetical protein